MAFGLDDLLAFFGDAGSAVNAGAAGLDLGLDAANGGGAALDTANSAFTVPDALDTTGVLSRGAEASATAPALSGYSLSPEPRDFEPKSGLGGDAVIDDANPGTQPIANSAMNVLPKSPTESFRAAVGALPGKWYDAFSKAPTEAVDYAGEHPFRTALGVGAMGLAGYNASKSAPSYNFPTPQYGGGGAPAPKIPDQSGGGSPILAGGGSSTRGRGGMSVRGL